MMDDTMHTRHDEFDRLFLTFEPSVRAYCARRVEHGSIDDAVNDTFGVAWRKLDEVPAGEAALPWLYGVAYRVIQHLWRTNGRAARLRTRMEPLIERPAGSLDDGLVEHHDRRRVLEAAALLGEDDREILRLTLWEELSSAETAAALGITPAAARQRASRARRRLASAFRQLEEHPEPGRDQPSIWARPNAEPTRK